MGFVPFGPSGEIRVGTRVAARLGPWNVQGRGAFGTPAGDGPWNLLAEVVERDAFWLDSYDRFDVVVETRDGQRLRWSGVQVVNEEMIAVLGEGPPEES